jgi:hypothetical protein
MTSRIDFSNPTPGSKTAVKMTSAVYRFKEKSIGLSYRLFLYLYPEWSNGNLLKEKIQTSSPRARSAFGSSFLTHFIGSSMPVSGESPGKARWTLAEETSPAKAKCTWLQPRISSGVRTGQKMYYSPRETG